MSSPFNKEKLASATNSFFQTITSPHTLISVELIENEKQYSKNNDLLPILQLCLKNNVQCFHLLGLTPENITWNVYYIDLESPILLYPTSNGILSYRELTEFLKIAKIISSNLNQIFLQEVEIIFIKTNQSDQGIHFFTHKAEDVVFDQLSNEFSFDRWKKRNPFGKRSEKNHLNFLTGREWIKFTKSWYIHRPPPRDKTEILHPAKFPEKMIRQYITFFTKPGQLVLDPFLGTGSTLLAAKLTNRNAVGIELTEQYTDISTQRLESCKVDAYPPIYQTRIPTFQRAIQGDSRNLLIIWKEHQFPEVDVCITSPPYWSQLERNSIRQKERKDQGLNTKYSEQDRDLGNITDYQRFIEEQKAIMEAVYEIMKNKGYLVMITNNVFAQGRLFPLAYDTATSLTRNSLNPWILKDERIWLQDDKTLLALGVNNAWVGNRAHQFCLIFRKE